MLALSACDASPLSCMEADLAISARFEEALAPHRACEVDADCGLFSPRVECADSQFAFCPSSARTDSLEDAQRDVQALGEADCVRVSPGCVSSATCAPATAECVEGVCRAVSSL
ncbi:MAG: hypothetical protein RLP09_43360 [Sandaracinaceae bacterium]